jgi:hypothetical protein
MMLASCRCKWSTVMKVVWISTDGGSWLGLSELCRSRRTESGVIYLDEF